MTVDEVSKELKVTPQRVREYCRAGRMGTKIGRQWLITRDELDAFKKSHPLPPGRPRHDE